MKRGVVNVLLHVSPSVVAPSGSVFVFEAVGKAGVQRTQKDGTWFISRALGRNRHTGGKRAGVAAGNSLLAEGWTARGAGAVRPAPSCPGLPGGDTETSHRGAPGDRSVRAGGQWLSPV